MEDLAEVVTYDGELDTNVDNLGDPGFVYPGIFGREGRLYPCDL